jgi:hypothetical protein
MSYSFDPANKEHLHRSDKKYLWPSGQYRIAGLFSTILLKVGLSLFTLLKFVHYVVELNSVPRFPKKPNFGGPITTSWVQKNHKRQSWYAIAVLPRNLHPGWTRHRVTFLTALRIWVINDAIVGHFHDICTISIDVPHHKKKLKPLYNGRKKYYFFDFDVVLLFGLTELKAQIAWKEDVCDLWEFVVWH